MPITITGSHPGDYQIKIIIPYDSDMRSDYGDLRFLETETTGVLNYWVENYTADNATVWVRRLENTDDTIYVYYGNPSASSASSWESTILSYTDSQATASAGWSVRSHYASVVFDNKMWVIGGYIGGGLKNDVWYSSDGVNWTQATASAGWSARSYHTSVVFDNKMWVIGGETWTSPYYKNDVWYSSDGVNWTQATASAGWSARSYHTSVVFDNKMWVMGGSGSDVWYSSDGVNWTRATASAGWGARYGHTSVVFNGKMWVIGGLVNGSYKNDVWYSSDGVNWTQATASAGWSARCYHTSVVFDGNMWVMGGQDSSGLKNDVWRLLRKCVSLELTVSIGSEEIFQGGQTGGKEPLWSYKVSGNIKSVAISSDGSYITAGGDGDKVYLFSKDSSTPIWSYKVSGNIKSVAISSDGSYITAGGDDKSLLLLKA